MQIWIFVCPASCFVLDYLSHIQSYHPLQDGKTLENELEVVEGMKFDRGYISPYFVTDPKTMTADLEDPFILIVEKKISTWATGTLPHFFSQYSSCALLCLLEPVLSKSWGKTWVVMTVICTISYLNRYLMAHLAIWADSFCFNFLILHCGWGSWSFLSNEVMEDALSFIAPSWFFNNTW